MKLTASRIIAMTVLSASIMLSSCRMSPSDPGSTSTDSAQTTSEIRQTSEIVETNDVPTDPEQLPPVENRAPETDYAPAFSGQTRAPGLKTVSSYKVDLINESLRAPWGIAVLPDARLAITEKDGTLRILTPAGELSEPITGFPELDTRSQGGLLDVVAALDFTSSGLLYFSFSELTDAGSVTAVGRARLNEKQAVLEDFETLFRATPYYDNGMHFGSRLVFDDNGNLFVSTGERSDTATRGLAQETDNGYGKVLYLTAEGEATADAPWIEGQPVWPEIYSYGHRNIQGLDIHPVTGELWVAEMGPRGGDELNLIKPGRNYGWPLISYGIEYGGGRIGEGAAAGENMEQPVYYWDPVLAPSGMTFYDSDVIPEWENNLFITGLRGQHIARLVLDGERVVGEERLLAEEGERFRDVEDMDGLLFAITDSGKLYRIGPE